MKKLIHFLFVAALSAAALWGQNAQISGQVRDASDSPVAGAQVLLTQSETGLRREVSSGAGGFYAAPLLPRGTYTVSVSLAGFKTAKSPAMLLEEGQSQRFDIRLELGQVSESIEVTAQAGMLSTESAAVALVVPNQRVVDLPLAGRNPLALANLVPGVRPVGQFGGLTVSSFDGSRASISGGSPSSNNYMVDGVAAENWASGGIQITLSPDATEEFRVITRNPSAEYGRSGGGFVNFISKSGTNQWHASAFEFLRNKELNANSFFNNFAGAQRAPFIFNQYGATVGGPVKRDKTFFFFNWEKVGQRTQDQTFRTVPTALQRQGNFSQTLDATGRSVVIYDPLTTRLDPSRPGNRIRTAFPGNTLPPNRLDPVARAVTSFYPTANLPGTAFTQTNNYFAQASAPLDKDVYGIRVDHNFSQNRRVFGRYTYDETFRGAANFYGNDAEILTSDLPFKRNSAVLSWIETIRPTLLLETRAGVNRYFTPRVTRSFGFDAASIGMNALVNSQMQVRQFPRFNVGDMTAIGAPSDDQLIQANDSYTLAGTLTWVRSAHTVKTGAESRTYRANNNQMCGQVFTTGYNRGFTQGPDPNIASAISGFGYATFLLGAPANGEVNRCPTITNQVRYLGLFLQDDWKLSRRLTLNLGLRYEIEGAITDRFDASSMFDPTFRGALNGINLGGGLLFPGQGGLGRGNREVTYTDFAPRLGMAFQVRNGTIFRAGYGISYLPTTGMSRLGQTGFAAQTPLVSTLDGFVPTANLANPFAAGINLPTGNSQGAFTGLGTNINGNLLNLQRGYSQQWSANIQQELPGRLVVEAGYMGNRGVSLPTSRTYRYLPESARALGNSLQDLVYNPYASIIGSGPLAQARVTRATLLNHFPQYTGAVGLDSWADSIYHAATLRVEKRFSAGASFLLSYTFSKLIDNNLGNGTNIFADGGDNGVQNWDNLRAERAVSTSDLPQRLVVTGSYEIPFPKAAPSALRTAFGGWQLNPLLTLQSGNVISVSANAPAFGGSRPNAIGDPSLDNPTIDGWLNRNAFGAIQPFTFGNAPRNLPRTRTDGLQNLDLSILKNFRFREKYTLQFRSEFFNLTNTPTFGNPAANITAGNFGVIRALATNSGPRSIQLALKFFF